MDDLFPLLILGGVAFVAAAAGFVAWVFRLAKKDGSPFVKIVAPTAELLASDPRLWGVVALTGAALAAGFAVVLLESTGRLRLPLPGRLESLAAAAAAATVLAATPLTVLDAILSDALTRFERGEPAGLASSLARVAARLPALAVFGALWSAILAAGTILRMEACRGLRDRGWAPVSWAVTVAGWALELGWTMASYFMIVMIVREGMGPFQAIGRAARLASAEFGRTMGEVLRVKLMDGAVFALAMAGFALTLFGSVFLNAVVLGTDQSSASPGAKLAMMLVPPFLAPLAVVFVYAAVFQVLQVMLAGAAYLYLRDGVVLTGFSPADYDDILGLRAKSLRALFPDPAPAGTT